MRFAQPAYERREVRSHVNHITVKLRTTLQRQADTQTFEKIAIRATVDSFAKTALHYLKLQHQGPPLHMALDWIGPRTNRAAVAALFGGDFFLGRYAGNYFATVQNSRQPALDLPVSVCTAGITCEDFIWKTNHMCF